MSRIRCLPVLLVMLCASVAVAAEARGVKIDFEGYFIRDRHCEGQPVANFECLQLPGDSRNQRGRRLNFITAVGSNGGFAVQKDPEKGEVLMMQLKPYADGCVRAKPECDFHRKDKVEFTPVNAKDAYSPDVRDAKPSFFKFDFKLDKHYEVGSGMVLHMQARQEMPRHSPIFAMKVRPLSDRKLDPATVPVYLDFVIRDDTDVAAKMAKNLAAKRPDEDLSYSSVGRTIHTQRVERDRWYTITLQMLPAYKGSGKAGHIVMWFDGEKKIDYRGDWGYKPQTKEQTAKISVALDIYRAPFLSTMQKIYFDNVNFSSSYEDVIVNGH